MRALVTGGAGFIGSHLIEALIADPRVTHVRTADNLSTGKLANIRPFFDRIEFIEGDLLDASVREKAVEGIDVIFHEAAIPSVPRSVADPIASHLAGDHLTLHVLDSARRAGVKRLIYAGSSSAYGDTEVLPKVETMPPNPRSPYAVSKLAGEYYAAVFARCYAIDTVTLRYFNVFGPRQDENSPFSAVIAKFCSAFKRNEPLTIHADGQQSRDFCHIDNVVSANLLAAFSTQPLKGEVLNIGCGERHTLIEMVEMLNALSGETRAPNFAPPRPGDVKHSQAGIDRARAVLGYEPRMKFKEGLAKTFEWYRQNS
ncbi:MAG: SDR family oxidoreductase [Planctomycetota bacterium]